jgi:hypothetical protein
MTKDEIHADYIKAGAPATTAQELGSLSTSQLPAIRRRIAENENTPANILERLSHDDYANVRAAVALNKTSPENVILRLAGDTNADVRHALASTSYVSEAILQLLSRDDNPHVAHRASQMLKKRGDALALIAINFQFFAEDHLFVIGKLQHLIGEYSNWPREKVIEETVIVLDRIRRHLERANILCLRWLDSMHPEQNLDDNIFQRSIRDHADLLQSITDILIVQEPDVIPVEQLSTLLSRIKAHKELHENELFKEIAKCLPG